MKQLSEVLGVNIVGGLLESLKVQSDSATYYQDVLNHWNGKHMGFAVPVLI